MFILVCLRFVGYCGYAVLFDFAYRIVCFLGFGLLVCCCFWFVCLELFIVVALFWVDVLVSLIVQFWVC